MKTQSKVIWTIVLGVALAGCTRLDGKGSVSISIAKNITIQKVNKKAGDVSAQSMDLSHVVINATGDGLAAPLVHEADTCRDCATPTAIGDIVINDIPAGQKLFQVLAVYSDSTSGQMVIKYGDTTHSVSGGDNNITVTTGSLSSGAIISGQLSGRYMTGPNAGPTGTLLAKFKPPGKEAMILTRNSISEGWFSTLILDGVNLTYEVLKTDGTSTVIFDNVSASSTAFEPASNIARVRFPPHYRQSGGVNGIWRPDEEKILIFGYWGSPADTTAKRVCYQTSEVGQLMNYRATDITGMTKLTYSASGPNPLYVNIEGGQNSEGPECDPWLGSRSANLYTNMLDLWKNNLDQNGGAQVAGFQGMFGIKNFSNDRLVATSYPNSTSLRMELSLLPGVSATTYDSVVAYKKVHSGEFYFRSDSVPCDLLSAGKIPGFEQVGEENIVGGSLGISIPLAKADRSNVNVALCPKKGGKVLYGGAFLGSYWLKAKYLKLEFPSGAGPSGTQLTRGACHPVYIKVMEGNDESSQNDSMSLNMSSMASTNGTFAMSGSCSTGSTSGFMSGNASNSSMYFKPSIVGINVTMSMNTDNPAIQFDGSQTYTVENPVLVLEGPDKIIQGVCYAYKLKARTVTGTDIASPATVTPTTTATGMTYFDGNADCSTATPITLNYMSPDTTVYLRVPASPSSYNLDLNFAGFTSAAKTVTVGAGGAITEFVEITAAAPPIILNNCNRMTVRLKNRDGAVIPAPFARTFALAVSPDLGSFYNDSSCGNPDNKVSMAINQVDGTIYFRPRKSDIMGGTLGISIAMINSPYPLVTTGTLGLPLNVHVTSPSAPAPYLYFSGIPTFNGKMIVGSHEFGAQRLIPITKSPGSYIECSTSEYSGYSVANCSGPPTVVDGSNNYVWTLADAETNQPRWFRAATSASSYSQGVPFVGSLVYGSGFKVVHCDTDMASNFSFPAFAGLITGTTCIGSGITISGSCGTGITLSTGSISIVGHTNGTSIIDAGSCTSGAAFTITGNSFNDANQTRHLANLKVNNLTGTFPAFEIDSVTGTFANGRILLSGNEITSSGENSAIRVNSLMDLDVSVDLFANKVNLSGGTSNFAIDVINHSSGYIAANDNLVISTNVNAIGVRNNVNAPFAGAPLNIDNYRYSGPGQALQAFGFSSYQAVTVVQNSDISISGYAGTRPAVESSTLSNMNFTNTRIVGESSTTSSGGLFKIGNNLTYLGGNTLVQKTTGLDFIRVITSTLFTMDDNQFVYTGGGTPPAAINGAGQSTVGILAPNATHGNNRFCTASATPWSTLFSFASESGSTFVSATALAQCMKTTDVTPAGNCMSPCDP